MIKTIAAFNSMINQSEQNVGKSTRKRRSALKRQEPDSSILVKQSSSKQDLSRSLYNHRLVPMEGLFHRDEIITGASLPLTKDTTFHFYDVCNIRLREHSDKMEADTSEATGDSSTHDNEDDNVALHRRQFPLMFRTVTNEEDTRQVVRHQTQTTKGKGVDGNLNKPSHKYMVKQVHVKCSNKDQAIAHLVHETNLLKNHSFKHHNLIELRGTTIEGDDVLAAQCDSLFLLTDRISETLSQRIQRWQDDGDPPTSRTNNNKATVDTTSLIYRTKLVYAQNLASVLTFLHSKRIAVRNMSPESVGFLALDDTLKLMDLGQAVVVSCDTTRTGLGHDCCVHAMLQQQQEHPLFQMTPGGQPYRYMAPELLTIPHSEQTAPTYGTNVDAYSWAMILFEMLTLHQPFAKMKAGQHLMQVALQNPSLRPGLEVYQLPKALNFVLTAAWRHDASKRLNAAEIDQRLKHLLQEMLHNSNPEQR